MKKRKVDPWFPFWIDKWLFGSTRIELEPDERGVFVDLMAMSKKDDGWVRANEGVPYLENQLCGLLNVANELLKRTIEKGVKFGKIRMERDGTFYMTSHEDYKLSPRQKRRVESEMFVDDVMADEADTMAEKEDAILKGNNKRNKNKNIHKEKVAEILKYFNEKTGKNFRKDPLNSISGRLNDGFTIEDCKRVIDIKTAQWLNDPENNKWLRPETLFRPTKFESYLNERMPAKKPEIGQSSYRSSDKDREYEKARAIKLKELQEKHKPEIEEAKRNNDMAKLEDIENQIKEEIAEFSRKHHG